MLFLKEKLNGIKLKDSHRGDKVSKIINIISILFLAIILSLNLGSSIYAAPKPDITEDTVNTKTYKFSDDVIFTGAFSSHSTYFNIDEWWKNTKVDAEINFCVNQLIEEEQKAYIKLSVNGTAFYS